LFLSDAVCILGDHPFPSQPRVNQCSTNEQAVVSQSDGVDSGARSNAFVLFFFPFAFAHAHTLTQQQALAELMQSGSKEALLTILLHNKCFFFFPLAFWEKGDEATAAAANLNSIRADRHLLLETLWGLQLLPQFLQHGPLPKPLHLPSLFFLPSIELAQTTKSSCRF
jgi:hypothetical protein